MQSSRIWRSQLTLWICLSSVVELCHGLLHGGKFKYVPEDQANNHSGFANTTIGIQVRSKIECGRLCLQRNRNDGQCVGFIYQSQSSLCRLLANPSDVQSSSNLGAAFAVVLGKESCPTDKGYQTVQYPSGKIYCLGLFGNAGYNGAVTMCQASGAHLFHFEGDMTKTDVATEFALNQNFQGNAFYIGLSDQITEGNWTWSYNMHTAVIPDHKWIKGRGPDDARGDEDCAVLLHPSSELQDIRCGLSRAYMCEVLMDI